jgi:predicted transport protein
MSDLKLFRIDGGTATEQPGAHSPLEKHLQRVVEANMETIFGLRFLQSEYRTGDRHGGRIDSLGIDETCSPVIFEYKRTRSENVINQGLFYLDWLMDHRAEFELLVLRSAHPELAELIDWSNPRLVCVATDFTRYDQHAVQQIARSIELIRYRDFGGELLALELVHSNSTETITTAALPAIATSEPDAPEPADASSAADHRLEADGTGITEAPASTKYMTVLERFEQAPQDLQDLFTTVADYCESLGPDVSKKTLKHWVSFRRMKSFASINIYPSSGQVMLFLKLDPDTVELKDGFTRDVRNIGHLGTGDLEVRVSDPTQLEEVYTMILLAYDNG